MTTKNFRFTPIDLKNIEEIKSITGFNNTEIIRVAILNYLNDLQDCYMSN